MWKPIYALLLLVRLYFALSPSYIHPDEHFQGPEIVAGELLNWHSQRTWEFTAEQPIRSFFPLWIVFGLPMKAAQWFIDPTPGATFQYLRVLFFVMSVVLGDWAFYKVIAKRTRKGWRLVLLASSYVTWTFQTHTFSNSVETVLVLWAVVLMGRLSDAKSSALLGFICAFGTFNRITFPAFVLLPGLRVLPRLWNRPASLAPLVVAAGITTAYAVHMDTQFYKRAQLVVTPLNNLLYNTQTSNLAQHGLHPRITHLLVNLPQLLGPALIPFVLTFSCHNLDSLPMLSSISGLGLLSILPHQEARFLLPCIPLILANVPLPRWRSAWTTSWILFNLVFGTLMGVYHQAGVVPAQLHLGAHTNATNIIYWKTYMAPKWLLGPKLRSVHVTDAPSSVDELTAILESNCLAEEAYFVAPFSAIGLESLVDRWRLKQVWSTKQHLNLDDLDILEEGVIGTIERVVGRRGLTIWKLDRDAC